MVKKEVERLLPENFSVQEYAEILLSIKVFVQEEQSIISFECALSI
jgi:hypothetical protein